MAWRWRNRDRWGDDDRNWGPFTYARDGRGYRPLAIVLKSRGDDDDESGDCTLRFSGFGHTLIMTVPPIIRPWRRWVDLSRTQFYKADGSPEPLRPDAGYWDIHSRQYGFSLSNAGDVGDSSFLQVFLGPQTHDSSTTKSWSTFLPWTEWRHVRRTLFRPDGSVFWEERDRQRPRFGKKRRAAWRDANWQRSETAREAAEQCPSRSFEVRDFDGEVITATARLEEREWRFGAGAFRWLSLFRKPMINRYVEIDFSSEVGRRKGSWKGGTISSHSPTEHGSDIEAAVRAYCAKNDLTFLHPA